MKERLILWFAQGFGSGRLPVSPGTAGSAVGILWFALLVTAKSPTIYFLGITLSIPVSIWLCGQGEKILRQTDPGSIVMDEIIAIPISFSGWLLALISKDKTWPDVEYFFTSPKWPMTFAIFIAFRIVDIGKPWPVRQSQRLRGGVGVTIDDVLAAFYVNVFVLLTWWFRPNWF